MKARNLIAIVLLSSAAALGGGAESLAAPAGSVISVPVAASAPSISGRIDSTWQTASRFRLAYDFTYRRPAAEVTIVRAVQAKDVLYIAFQAEEAEHITAQQTSDGPNVLSDDYVGVYLYPQGVHGFAYSFIANGLGARYQTSSENSAYAPRWKAISRVDGSGYIVMMAIPLAAIRSAGSHTWSAQFVRANVATNSLYVWTYSAQEENPEDPTFAGILSGVGLEVARRSYPKPRFQTYALGEAANAANGGSTSRIGADVSIPITATASFVSTLHPDYSNVEIDQQTIAPSAFARQYSDVRPFFTQVGSLFNQHFGCDSCPQMLYTTAIPTFSQGYALEGTQGAFSFAGFDALGNSRDDNAQTANYQTETKAETTELNVQRVAVTMPGLSDIATGADAGYMSNVSHVGGYVNFADDRQSVLGSRSSGSYFESGLTYETATTDITAALQNIGPNFNPVDGYVSQNDIYGYEAGGSKSFNFSPQSLLRDVGVSTFYARYHDQLGQPAQFDGSTQVNLDFRDLLTFHVFGNSQAIRVPAYADDLGVSEVLPFSASGAFVGYRVTTTTPSYVEYSGGPYYHGELNAWSYFTTVPLLRRLNLNLEADSDRYFTSRTGEESTSQWLERVSLDWQISHGAELIAGVRKIVGTNLPNAFQDFVLPSAAACGPFPYSPGCSVNTSNVSVALHILRARSEFYIAYGDPNAFSTVPTGIVKWIQYFGADKGT